MAKDVRLPAAAIKELAVPAGEGARLDKRPTDGLSHHGWVVDWLAGRGKDAAKERLAALQAELREAQELLFADHTKALLLIFQGMDASGKDGTIERVLDPLNPQGFRVTSFKQPSQEELHHDFLWRSVKALPELGLIGVFNRSYYEDVLVVRVHPELLAAEQATPPGARLWKARFCDINNFEHHLVRSGTTVAKFFLHVSREEQRGRLLDRLQHPEKNWKFSPSDLTEREFFDAYQEAYDEAIGETSTEYAPWYVVPADDKPVMRALVCGVVLHTLENMNLRVPEPDAARRQALADARARLEAEED
jgi:PPK2 family polyphosphate:nucleotide phosphotransferase